jgi:hypothetical protein
MQMESSLAAQGKCVLPHSVTLRNWAFDFQNSEYLFNTCCRESVETEEGEVKWGEGMGSKFFCGVETRIMNDF